LTGQRVVFGFVEHDLELLAVLVVALQHAHLGHVREAEDRSEVALLNSAASRRPRSIAGTISLPGSAFTAAPMPLNRSIEMPTVRYFMRLEMSGW